METVETIDDPDDAPTEITQAEGFASGDGSDKKEARAKASFEEASLDDEGGPSVVTDIHRSRIPADDPRLKMERPRSRTLRPGPVVALAVATGGVIVVALCAAMIPSAAPQDAANKGTASDQEVTLAGAVPLPDMFQRERPETASTAPAPPSRATSRPLADPESPSSEPNTERGRALDARKSRYEGFMRARGAGIFAAAEESAPDEPAPRAGAPVVPDPLREGAKVQSAPAPPLPGQLPDANMQERKNDFLVKAGLGGSEYLQKAVTMPRSPYELKAGTVIPTVLITGINSDLPGQIVGQVRENVYDTVSGNYLLVPQGSRVIAAYDSMVAWGQERVLVCWNRIIRPDGSSIVLDCMPGVDLGGYAGFADEVDNHWWRIIS
jgi:type IV secretory pathway VirB10-like protein